MTIQHYKHLEISNDLFTKSNTGTVLSLQNHKSTYLCISLGSLRPLKTLSYVIFQYIFSALKTRGVKRLGVHLLSPPKQTQRDCTKYKNGPKLKWGQVQPIFPKIGDIFNNQRLQLFFKSNFSQCKSMLQPRKEPSFNFDDTTRKYARLL